MVVDDRRLALHSDEALGETAKRSLDTITRAMIHEAAKIASRQCIIGNVAINEMRLPPVDFSDGNDHGFACMQ